VPDERLGTRGQTRRHDRFDRRRSGDDRNDSDATGDSTPSDRKYVDRAIELAEEAVEMGNTPFGALLVPRRRDRRRGPQRDADRGRSGGPPGTGARAVGRPRARRRRARPLYDVRQHGAMPDVRPGSTTPGSVGSSSASRARRSTGSPATRCRSCAEVIRRAGGDTTVEGPIVEAAAMELHESVYGES